MWRGFSAAKDPSRFEIAVARGVRNLAIPRRASAQKNPLDGTAVDLQQGRDDFLARCSSCHGRDGSGLTPLGRNLYPRVPDLRSAGTQRLSDGDIHYIIENGVELTGMPAWGDPRGASGDAIWRLVLYVRSLNPLSHQEVVEQARTAASAHYAGSQACQKCHAQIYERWKKTPMANVVRDLRQHPDAIIPDLATNTVAAVHQGPGRLRLRQPLEAALLHEDRRRLFSVAGPVGGAQPRVEPVRRAPGSGLVGAALPRRQHEAADRPDLRRLSFGRLRHPHEAGRRMERRLREVPRSGQRARRASLARQHPEPGAHGPRARRATPASSATRRDAR